MGKAKKILTGFRLSEGNVKFIEETGQKLGINKTSALDLMITVVRKDKSLLSELIEKALHD